MEAAAEIQPSDPADLLLLAKHAIAIGSTPLHLAAAACWLEKIKILLEELNIDINLRDKDGNTALHIVFLE